MDDKPLVTVIVPAYNHEKYVVECLDSIYNQTYKDFQWIVVDDGSKDTTPVILRTLQEKYGYELIIQENHGLSWTLTNVIKNFAKGKYISICASDDKWLLDKLRIQVEFMKKNPDFAMCYGKTKYMDLDSKITREDDGSKYKSGFIFEDILLQNFHPPVNYMYKVSALESVGYFLEGIIAEDYYMNCKLSENFKIGYIDEFLTIYREAPLHKKRDPLLLLKSHEDTINLYKDTEIYAKAISSHNLRCFDVLSSYTKYKILSIRYLFKVRGAEIKFVVIIKGLYHLLRWWV